MTSPFQDKQEAVSYLESLLNKNLRVTTTDSRIFVGAFKCTDAESNIVLQYTYEYRHPTPQQAQQQNTTQGDPTNSNPTNPTTTETTTTTTTTETTTSKIKLDLTSRYLGLVVVPGQYIVKIEVEEFASQLRGRGLL
ncbi:uncharacterized protein C8A04DRAFT_15582 [Dichotomopilus funicola]|uniref:Sm domain-containing protein n=1 Tax=Dichotomopilus funicola TaxID=1934379 RepID=A0AAN6UV99_9PEZI|nr:hypothetical protein C8A04DRAFT_15582 [Dichotomopilus funicola]